MSYTEFYTDFSFRLFYYVFLSFGTLCSVHYSTSGWLCLSVSSLVAYGNNEMILDCHGVSCVTFSLRMLGNETHKDMDLGFSFH